MSTTSQKFANRQNAKHSTGPVTDAGKQTCSQNGLKHGLASGQLIVFGESEEEFDALLTGLIEEHKPTTITETLLVQDMAKYHWLVDRAIRMQNIAMELAIRQGDPSPAGLPVLIRYQTTNQRAFEKSFAMLLNLRKQAEKSAIGSASQQAAKPSPQSPQPAHSADATTPVRRQTAEKKPAMPIPLLQLGRNYPK